MTRRLRVVVAACWGVAVLVLPDSSVSATPSVAYRFVDPRIDEASGIAAGVRSPGIDYVQNDSGDTNRFFAIDAATGATAATITVPGATNVDWEDIAVAPDAGGTSSVWLADTGDNRASRSEVQVYRVDEPRVSRSARGLVLRTARPDVWRLRYPTGPVDAESLAVTPRGVAYVITKSLFGESDVYRLPATPDPDRVQTLVPVGRIAFTAHPTRIPLGELGTLTATSAAISADGALLAVRTYADAFVWRLRDDDVAAALRTRPTRITLPVEPQGEGVAIVGDHLLVDSEGIGTAVYSVPLPAALTRPFPLPATSSTRRVRPSAATTPSHSAAPPSDTTAGDGGSGAALGGGVVAGVLVLGVAGGVVRRRRRAR